MKTLSLAISRRFAALFTGVALSLASLSAAAGPVPDGFTERYADTNGARIHYLIGGSGSAVVLLHGYAQTGHMWNPVMPMLASGHTVIVPDLRGAGDSSKPDAGYDKKNMAADIHGLVSSLGFKRASVTGHDIGLMVAYAYAAQYPRETERLVLMDAFLPGIGDWKNVWLMRDLWHFHFRGEVPLELVKGRERTYFEHFWNDFAADPKHSVPEEDRRFYAAAYAKPGGMRAGFEYFANFERDAQDFAVLGRTPLPMPVMVLTGEKASGAFLIEQGKLVATNVEGRIIEGAGHWLMEEAPQAVMPKLVAFLNAAEPPAAGLRATPSEIEALHPLGGGTGTSGVSGIQTRLLTGDPAKYGLYVIQLTVPPNTRIEAHDHPDDRVATVISGTWHLGYGSHFDEKELKELSPGSFYTEPPHKPHFARTGTTAAVVQITGFGPSGTRYTSNTVAPKQ